MLYQNETFGISSYESFKKIADFNGLEIVNSEASRVIPAGLTRDNIKNHTDVLQGVLDSKARLVISFMFIPLLSSVLEVFYDLGARKGDIIILSSISTALVDIGFNDTVLYKRLEIGCPMIAFQSPVWVGEFGKSIYANLQSKYQATPSDLSCNYFDALYFLASSIDWMINRGLDYSDPHKLNIAIRGMKIHGCSGSLAIEKGSNDRAMEHMSIDSNKVVNGKLVNFHSGEYKPYSTKYLQFSIPLVYGDGGTEKPNDLRINYYECPFDESKIRKFEKGRGLVFGICFGMAVITAVITYFIWKK